MAARKSIAAKVVRDWASTEDGSKALVAAGAKFPGSRGRLDPSTLAVFHKANPRLRYTTASDAEKPTITVPVKSLDSIGRVTTKKVTVTTAHARALLGQTGKRGRFNKGLLSMALEAEALAS